MAINEYLLTTDSFKNPKMLKNKAAVSAILARLILLEPGTNTKHPKMGVGLVSRYRYTDEDNVSELRKDIAQQVATYLPTFQSVEVNIQLLNDHDLHISIRVGDTSYEWETEKHSEFDIGLNSLTI